MSDTLPVVRFGERQYEEIVWVAESADRTPEEFIERSLRAGLQVSDVLLSFPAVLLTAEFETIKPGNWEYQPLWRMPEHEGFRQYRQEAPPATVVPSLNPGLVQLVTLRAAQHRTVMDDFIDWSLDIGDRWERSAGIGYQFRISSGTQMRSMSDVNLREYPGEKLAA